MAGEGVTVTVGHDGPMNSWSAGGGGIIPDDDVSNFRRAPFSSRRPSEAVMPSVSILIDSWKGSDRSGRG